MAFETIRRPKPGLKSINEGREARKTGKYSRPSGGVWLVAVGAIVASLVAYKIVSGHQLDSAKRDLLGKQRAMTTTIGAEWIPLRDEIERWTLDAAKEYRGDFVDPEAARWDFRSAPGIYLRLRVADAKDVESLRKAAADSQKDAFTGCFLREPNPAAARGGDVDAGHGPDQPWNLSQAYLATRVMSDDWANEVKAAEDPLRLRVFEQQYDRAAKQDISVAADVIKRAQFFLLVLDEDVDAAKAAADGGPIDEQALQTVPHPSRVHVWNLRTKDELLRLRRTGDASFVFAGEHMVAAPEMRAAMQRQVNNCSLASEVRAAIVAVAADAGVDAGR